ncbi:hypothetical protein [Roseobacter sp. CCS2]|uniref:hypothetical protein n=1 Tax=Roseobacter sp. CCS2 TaxID=391593 RepID=UPI0000F3E5EE|nr:hypothetical protein [Roseobacter sp. CCS2]EBA11097.1 hypothetical protein RCCS2_01409 [Roseobacter sp. CCS2]
MSFPKIGFALTAIFLAACEAGPINGTSDSLANRLEVGMTPAQVGRIIGQHQFESRASADDDRLCRSYIYDEAIDSKFVHAIFDDDQLVSASDRHRTACALP